jgi:hypothetical protein
MPRTPIEAKLRRTDPIASARCVRRSVSCDAVAQWPQDRGDRAGRRAVGQPADAPVRQPSDRDGEGHDEEDLRRGGDERFGVGRQPVQAGPLVDPGAQRRGVIYTTGHGTGDAVRRGGHEL